MKHSHSFLKYYLKASGDHFTSQAITFNCEISSLFKFTTSTILCMCTFVNYLLGNNVLCSYVIVNFIFALFWLSILSHSNLLEKGVGLFFMRHSREVGNLFARRGGYLCSIAGPINKGALEALYARAVRMLLHEIQQSCDLPFTQLENQQEGGPTDASVQNCRFLYQRQFAFYNRSSLDSCSLIKVTHPDTFC